MASISFNSSRPNHPIFPKTSLSMLNPPVDNSGSLGGGLRRPSSGTAIGKLLADVLRLLPNMKLDLRVLFFTLSSCGVEGDCDSVGRGDSPFVLDLNEWMLLIDLKDISRRMDECSYAKAVDGLLSVIGLVIAVD